MTFKRKVRKKKAKDAQKELQNKVMMFDQLDDVCLVCGKPFDKKDRKMVNEWFVVVRQKEEVVNLYCPECWNRAKELVEELKEQVEDDGEEKPT